MNAARSEQLTRLLRVSFQSWPLPSRSPRCSGAHRSRPSFRMKLPAHWRPIRRSRSHGCQPIEPAMRNAS